MTKELILESIVVNPDQPRKHFDEEPLRQLAESIKADGLQSPILVRPVAGKFEIVQGERRYRAHVIAGLDTIRADVRELSDEDAFHLAVIENIQREQLTEMEEAHAFQRYVELGLTHDAIAKKVNKSRTYVTTKLRLLKLIPEVQDLIAEGVISNGHAVQILKIEALIDRLCGKRCFKGDEKTAFDFFQKVILNSIKSAKGTVTVNVVAGIVDALRERFLAAIIAVFTGHWYVHIEKYESFSVTAHGYCLQYDLRIESLEPGDIDFLRDRMLKGAENDPEAPARWEIYQRTDRLAEAMFSDGIRPAWPEDEIARRSQKIYNETTGEFDDGLMDRVFRQQFVFHDDDVSCGTL